MVAKIACGLMNMKLVSIFGMISNGTSVLFECKDIALCLFPRAGERT